MITCGLTGLPSASLLPNNFFEISYLSVLAAMNPDLQKQFENIEAYDMIVTLKCMFETQARTERYEI